MWKYDRNESACNAGNPGSIPGSGRSPGEGNGNPLQYSCLENLMDRGAWEATVCGVTKIQTRLKLLNTQHTGGRIPFSLGDLSLFLLKPSANWIRPTHI